ncbi:MAG TPA: type II secretion system protein GspL [Allosphingosinicella sp.]|nr:type II secretion system protein GspL [Allosphingosinicella sp.]
MKISVTEAVTAETALVFLDEDGVPGHWLLFDSDEVILRGESGEPFPTPAASILAVPGEKVAVHWLELAEGLAPAQAAAAARLLLADFSAEPIADLHVAVGRPEDGQTPVAMLPSRLMGEWLAAAASAGLDPAVIVPTPMLLRPPLQGFVRRDRGAVTDYRGEASAFSLEPELAEAIIGDRESITIPPERFEAELPAILADPPLNLRQGPFARRRNWRKDSGRLRRILALGLAFILLTLAVQVTMILRYTFAADALEAEARTLSSSSGARRSGNFSGTAAALFGAVRGTPNVELTRLEFRPDGSLTATLQADSPASLVALEQRAEASGLDADVGVPRTAGGRPVADLTVRP